MKRHERGDTLVELVLAFAVFSLAAIGTLIIMNKGVSIAQRSLETTLVRQQIDGQAEMIRYIRDTDQVKWAEIKSKAIGISPMPLSGPCPTAGSLVLGGKNGFYVVPGAVIDTYEVRAATSANYVIPALHAKIDSATKQSHGIWIQTVKSEDLSGKNIVAYDFYIHGCWDSVGQSAPMTLGTIVRIYDK